MYIYLVRHGEAVPEETDPKRPLSAKGRNEVEGTARELRAPSTELGASEGAKIDEIWHSEKLRAKQTAQIIARDLGISRVIEKKGLKPDDDPAPIAEELRQIEERQASGEAGNVERNAKRVTQDAERFALHKRPTHNALLIVSHLPFIPKLVQLLKPELGKVELKTGGVIRVDL